MKTPATASSAPGRRRGQYRAAALSFLVGTLILFATTAIVQRF
jgi:hypothetical protein